MQPVTLLTNTSFVVGFERDGHVLYKNGEVAYQGDTVIYAGKKYPGRADTRIDVKNGLIIPGLINLHCHIAASPVEKGFIEDCGSRNFYGSGLYEYLRVTHIPVEDQINVFRFSLMEVIKKGSTTIYELGLGTDEMINIIGESGVRAYIGPMARSCVFMTKDGHTVHYEWDEPNAFIKLDECLCKHARYAGSYDDRIRLTLYPGQVDCVTPDYLKEVKKAADNTGMLIQIHAAQSINEYQTVFARHGMTPAEFLAKHGICGPSTLYSHYIVPGGHSLNTLELGDELMTIADTKTHVVHCPWVFGRRGIILESFSKYSKMGINLGLGTDSYPQDMLHEMRCAAIFGKIAETDTYKCTAAEVFDAATLNGAKALNRTDIGRLCEGSKADIVVVDTNNIEMCPLRDPIKALVYTATSANIDKVIVNGNILVDGGTYLGGDEAYLRMCMQEAGERMWANVVNRDYKSRTHLEISPMSYPVQ